MLSHSLNYDYLANLLETSQVNVWALLFRPGKRILSNQGYKSRAKLIATCFDGMR
jgi:hypothetical protein